MPENSYTYVALLREKAMYAAWNLKIDWRFWNFVWYRERGIEKECERERADTTG